jgi:formylglycine-generating enzyme
MQKSGIYSSIFCCVTLVFGCSDTSSQGNGNTAAGGTTASSQSTSTGGAVSTTGTATSTSSGTSVGGSSASKTSSLGGAPSSGGATGAGCTGGLEEDNGKGLCVAKMVTIEATPSYQIDATEVTQGQYRQWVATKPPLPQSTDPMCGWKSDASNGESFDIKGPVFEGANEDHHPVFRVDWCDAFFYCKGVGKRLCGKIGGGSNDYASFKDASTSQWYHACSANGANKFPYGNTYDAKSCNGSQYGANETVVVGSLSTCQSSASGFAGVFDLSGNIREWEDACTPGTEANGIDAYCRVRGGDIISGTNDLPCDFEDGTTRPSSGYNYVGFRCCSD